MTLKSHWQASAKSIYVRTVWINGVRHAILSKNDPLANGGVSKRPYSCGNILQSETKEAKRKTRSSPSSNDYTQTISVSTSSSNESPIDALDSNSEIEYEYRFDMSVTSDDDLIETEIVQEEVRESTSYKKIKLPTVNAKVNPNNSLRENQQSYGYFMKNHFINPITERVLNWLDLASKEAANATNNSSDELDGKVDTNDKSGKIDRNTNRLDHRVSSKTADSYLPNATARDVEQYNEMSERNRAWARSRDTSQNRQQTTQGNCAENHQNNKGHARNLYESSGVINREVHRESNGTEAKRVQLDGAKTERSRKLRNSSSEETNEPNRPNTTNFMFDFTTSTVRTPIEKALKPNTNPYSKHIRKNEEVIRRNNENISKLARNIDEFQRTNEIVCQTARQRTNNKNTNDHNSGRNSQSGPVKTTADNYSKDNNKHRDQETDLNNNIDKDGESRTKSRQKNRRKSKSRRRCLSRESDESRLEDENSDEEFDDTIR